ncbi:low choriolytic enzyme-like [Symphorus nematophorus]
MAAMKCILGLLALLTVSALTEAGVSPTAGALTSQKLDVIKRGINSFCYSTCIRFFTRTNQRDYLYIHTLYHQGNGQTVSLSHWGCIYYRTVQHELLHTLGFIHEQCRTDRDQNIQVLLQNIIKGQAYNFNKIITLYQGTLYNHGSVMHYSSLAFSKNNYNPTMVAVPNPNALFGTAEQMSQNDINHSNLLYCRNQCSVYTDVSLTNIQLLM